MSQRLALVLCVLAVFAGPAQAAEWQPGTFYALGAQVTYQGPGYECITAHTSQVGWEPNVAGSLWRLASGTPVPTPAPTPTTPPAGGEITPPASGVLASTQDSNVAGNAVDNSLSTRWSGNGDGAWIRFDLGTARMVGHVRVAVHQGNARRNRFDLQVSTDGSTWTAVFSGTNTGTTTQEETYDFSDRMARYVRYVGHGATHNAGGTTTWNSVSEVSIFSGISCPTPTPIPTPRPVGLIADAGDTQVSLAWQSGTGVSGAHTYEVHRATVSGGPYDLVATVNTSGTPAGSHVDTGLTNDTTYFYVVREVYTWVYPCNGQTFRVTSANSDERWATPQGSATPTSTPTPTATPTPTPRPTATPCCLPPVEVTPGAGSVSASTNDGNLPGNTVDNSLSTRWSANGDGQWISYDLGSTRVLTHVTIGFYAGNTRQARFDIQVSNDNATWANVLTGAMSSGTSTQEQYFDVNDASARWVRYLGHGNSANAWNSVLEVSLFARPDVGARPTPTPTSTPTSPPIPTPTPTPTGGPGGGFPARVSAPYIDALAWPIFSMTNAAAATGHKYYTLAFFQDGGGCTPKWGGLIPIADDHYADQIASLRGSGGDVIFSFGGAAGLELAQGCSSVSALQAAYQQVVTHYRVKWMDLDIEGAAIADTAANDRRNKALKALQSANPGLRVSYTLPVMPDGLTHYGLDLLSNAKANGVRVDVVNVMAMDYGPCIDMGQAAIDAARNTNAQMGQIGLSTKIGVTPMIGVNDVTCEVFRLDDADQFLAYAQANTFIAEVAFWSMNRDNGDCPGSGSASPKCSGLSQSLFAFANRFKAFR